MAGNYDFLGGRLSGGSNRNTQTGSLREKKSSSSGDNLEIQDSLNNIYDQIQDCYTDAGKVLARYATNENKKGNTSVQSMDKKIHQFLNGYNDTVKVEILIKALAQTIANI